MKKILFITHDAHLTGAPMLLLNLIRLLKESGNYNLKLVIKKGVGPLVPDFSKHCETVIWKKADAKGFKEKIANRLFSIRKQNSRRIQQWIDESDFVISNTITNGDILKAFNFSKVKSVLSYVHELEMATQYYTSKEHVALVTNASHHFLVPSNAVAKHLVNNLKINPQKISTLNYFIPFNGKNESDFDVNKEIFVVGIIGTLDWRKGADILSVAVSALFKKYPSDNIQFIWKGANIASVEFKRISIELDRLNLSNKVKFDLPSKEVDSFYQSINVFLLLSKEDPYPLVVLEAASYCKPCICFNAAGGAPEFVQDDAGKVISYLDIEQLVETIHDFYINRGLSQVFGKVANERYKTLHLDKELIISQFESALITVLI